MPFNAEIVVIAGGFGTRLNEVGKQCPKGLIPFRETTLLGRMLSQLKESGGDFNIALITNNKFFPAYTEYLAKNYSDLNIKLINDSVDVPENRLGALGDLKMALDQLNWWNNRDLLVLPSDTYFDFPLSELFTFYQEHPEVTTVFNEIDKALIKNRLGCAVIKDNQVVEFIEKPENPPSNFAAVPIYIYPKDILPELKVYIDKGLNIDAPGQVIPEFVKNHHVRAFTFKGKYVDVGKPEDLEALKNL